MESTIYATTCWGEKHRICADWSQCSSQISVETEDGWWPTGMQVAEVEDEIDAMRRVLYEHSGVSDEEAADEIEEAVAAIHAEDEEEEEDAES